MFGRRSLLEAAGVGALLAVARGRRILSASLQRTSSPQESVVFDAMGEIRDVYTPELLEQILASGLNAVTVTICDPKTFEYEAMQAALDGILAYDAYIASLPELLLKATKTADIERAREERKLAIFYLFQNSTQFGRDLDRVGRAPFPPGAREGSNEEPRSGPDVSSRHPRRQVERRDDLAAAAKELARFGLEALRPFGNV